MGMVNAQHRTRHFKTRSCTIRPLAHPRGSTSQGPPAQGSPDQCDDHETFRRKRPSATRRARRLSASCAAVWTGPVGLCSR